MSASLTFPAQIAAGKTLLTPDQAAEYLHIKKQTLANYRVDGKGPKFLRRGRVVRYRLASLDLWLGKESAK